MADRISDLPDPILCQILSSLPTKLAATTTVLSHRWKSMYLQLRTLDFDFNDGTLPHFNSFINFISATISARDITLPIHSFSFKCSNYDSNQIFVDEILNFAFERLRMENLNSLKIISPGTRRVRFPQHILSCKNLQILELNNVRICCTNFEFAFDFPHLKALRWNDVKFFNRRCMNKFLSSCPGLEELQACNSYFMNCENDRDENKLNPFPNLASAWIFYRNWIPITLLSEVQSLHLELNVRWIRGLKLPLFQRLTNIDIIFSDVLLENQLKRLLQLLEHCPKLQNFKIQDCVYGNQHEMDGKYWIDPPTVPQCLSSQLKTFFLGGYKGKEIEFQFVKYIMQNSKVLQTMTIKSNPIADINGKHQMLMKISSTTMGCTTCKLVFD